MTNILTTDITGDYFPIYFTSKKFEKLLVIQTIPINKIIFKDKEISIEELTDILERAI